MGEVGKDVVQRGDAVVVIIFVCIGGAMVWIAPTLTCLEADHVCLGEVAFEFRQKNISVGKAWYSKMAVGYSPVCWIAVSALSVICSCVYAGFTATDST